MLLSSSFTSNSEGLWRYWRLPYGKPRYRREIALILLSTLCALLLIDAAVGLVFRPSADPRHPLSRLQGYFDYGRSLEGKLRRMVGPVPGGEAPIVHAGWIEPDCTVASEVRPGKLGIDIYGMSFSNHIADAMERVDHGLSFTHFGGPAAPANHSYACFIRREEAGVPRSPVQILGVLASSLPRLLTLSGLTTSFEAPMPFTYPRYTLEGQELVAHWPSVRTEADLRSALDDPGKWRAFLDELATSDFFYEPALVHAGLSDNSVTLRMVRRALAQRMFRERMAALRVSEGFAGAEDVPLVLNALLLDFAKRTRAAGERPLVILIEDAGFGGTLSRFSAPVMKANNIDYFLTSSVASPDDTGNFQADGHFIPKRDVQFAHRVLKILGRE
jgi:hypothetical protein